MSGILGVARVDDVLALVIVGIVAPTLVEVGCTVALEVAMGGVRAWCLGTGLLTLDKGG